MIDIVHDIVHDIVNDIYDINFDIVCDIVYDININLRYFSDFSTQVEKLVRILKHKLRLDNAYFKAQGFDAILSAPKEELHQLLIGLYGEHLLPATMYEIEKALRNPNTIRGFDKNGAPIYIISNRDPHEPVSRVVALLPMFPIRNTYHMRHPSESSAGPSFKMWFPPRAVFGSRCEETMQGLVPFKALCLEYIHSSISNV